MANFIRNTQVKAMTSIWAAKQKARELTDRTKEALPSASRICSITRADVWRNRRGVMPRRTFYQGGFLWSSERRSNGR